MELLNQMDGFDVLGQVGLKIVLLDGRFLISKLAYFKCLHKN
jgi:ATP-dependent 26S proteasome regulatory subunit